MPKLQSKAKSEFRYLAGNLALPAYRRFVGEPWPMLSVAGRLSGKDGDHLLLPVLHPNSLPLVTWQIRVGLYHGIPMSYSISESYANKSPASLKAMSNALR